MGRELPCRHKRRYSSGSAARKALKGVRKKGDRTPRGKPQRVYYCDFCGGYHQTSWGYR